MRTTDSMIRLLSENIQPAAGRTAWHGGPTPVGAVRGVTAREAARLPRGAPNSIWALTLHIAYWNSAVRRRITGERHGRFPRSPANWPALPSPASEAAWAADRALLAEEHGRLVEVVAALTPRDLARVTPGGRRYTVGELVTGVAQHDAWHTGQIQLLKRLVRSRAG